MNIFLARLHKEKKIQLVEPSTEIKDAYLQRSEESLRSAKALLQVGTLKDAIALTYYSMYYSLLALLFRNGIKCENHTGAIILLKEVFEFENEDITHAKKEKVDKQYYVDFSVTREEVVDMLRIAEDFNARLLDFIEKLNNEKISNYRDTYKRLICQK